jgi:hypothetical protein
MGTVLAKHGYTVEYGYFNGTCRGSDRQPIQTERTITDATIVGLGKFAAECDESAANLRAGTTHPSRIKTGEKLNPATSRYEAVYIAWEAGSDYQKLQAVERAVNGAERDASHARAHARSLKKMAEELHGTALVAIDDFRKAADEAKARKAAKPTVDVKAATVSGAFGSKAARKEELDKINRLYSKQIDALQAIYLALPSHERELGKRTEVYYAPMYPHQWKAKHSALALKEFPQAAAIVAEIEQLVAAREAVKAAP